MTCRPTRYPANTTPRQAESAMLASVNVTIYHNPKCSKSRRALELIRGRGIEPTIIEYLEQPPSASELEDLLKKLGLEPRALIRTGEADYEASGLAAPTLTREQLVAGLAAHPRLIERPLVVNGSRAVVGRPPEKVLELL
jgi:arsenate reductase (glutaredoxin)